MDKIRYLMDKLGFPIELNDLSTEIGCIKSIGLTPVDSLRLYCDLVTQFESIGSLIKFNYSIAKLSEVELSRLEDAIGLHNIPMGGLHYPINICNKLKSMKYIVEFNSTVLRNLNLCGREINRLEGYSFIELPDKSIYLKSHLGYDSSILTDNLLIPLILVEGSNIDSKLIFRILREYYNWNFK